MKLRHLFSCLISLGILNDAAILATAQTDFGSVTIGAQTVLPITVTFETAGTLAQAVALTQGVSGLDFSVASGGTCVSGTKYAVGATCIVNVTFKPKLAGLRIGGVVLDSATTASSSTLLGTALVVGTGVGPQLVFEPGTEVVVANYSYPGNLAVDPNGNIYIATGNQVYELAPGVSGYSVLHTFDGGYGVGGIVIDGSGAIYIAGDDGVVHKETPNNGSYIETQIGSGMDQPNAIALDNNGNLYVADAYNGRVLKETLYGGTYTQTDILDCGDVGRQSCPAAVAVDPAGNLFVTSYNSSSILKLTPSSGGYTQSTIPAQLTWPSDIVSDRLGNLYIADTLNDRVVKETVSGDSYTQSTIATSSIYWPWGLAVDAENNVYVSDTYHGRILKEDRWDPPVLSFSTTDVGATSKGSPQKFTVRNSGNASLTIPVPASGSNPVVPANFTLNSNEASPCPVVASSAASPGSLAAGASCQMSISFTPATDVVANASLLLKDNDLNAGAPNYSTQAIKLIATTVEAAASKTTGSASASSVVAGLPITVTAVVTSASGTGPVPTGSVTFTNNAPGGAAFQQNVTLDGTGTASFTTSSLAVSNYALSAKYNGDSDYDGSSAASAIVFAVVAGAPSIQIVSVNANSPSSQYGLASYNVVVGVYSTGDAGEQGVTVTASGAGLMFSTASPVTNTNGQATFLVTPSQAGSLTATFSATGQSVTQSFTIAQAPLTVVATNAERGYGAANPSLTGKVTGLVGSDAVTVTWTTTATTNSPVGSYPTSAMVSGAALSNYRVTVVPGTLKVVHVPLLLTAKGYAVTYGSAVPLPTEYELTGFVNGEGPGIVTGAPALSTTAERGSPVAYYPITVAVNTLTAPNYTIVLGPQEGSVRISKATLTVAPDPKTVVQGGPMPPFTYQLSGWVNGDGPSAVTGAAVLTTRTQSYYPVGQYPILASRGTLAAANYTFATESGVLTIVP